MDKLAQSRCTQCKKFVKEPNVWKTPESFQTIIFLCDKCEEKLNAPTKMDKIRQQDNQET